MNFATPGHKNYVSMDSSPYGREVLEKMVQAKFISKYSTIEEATKACGGKRLVLSRMALITTTTRTGELNHILILDCRVSGANAATKKWGRVLLPRILDVLQDSMLLQAVAMDDESVLSYYVCDVSDAFFAAPLNPG